MERGSDEGRKWTDPHHRMHSQRRFSANEWGIGLDGKIGCFASGRRTHQARCKRRAPGQQRGRVQRQPFRGEVQPSNRAKAVVSLGWASRWCRAVNGWRSGLDAASAGVEGGGRWCRGCLAGRDGVHGHAARLGRSEQRCRSKVVGERFPCTSEDGRRILLGGRLVFEAQLLARPINGRCRSLLSCLAPVVSPSGLGFWLAGEFRHAQRRARGDPIGGPARWVAALHVQARDAHAAQAGGLAAGDGTWAGCCMCCELGDKAGSTRRGRQRACVPVLGRLCRAVAFACKSNPIHAAARLDRPPVSLTPAEDSPELRPDPAQVAMAVRVDLPT
jgi:hypothetical protein